MILIFGHNLYFFLFSFVFKLFSFSNYSKKKRKKEKKEKKVKLRNFATVPPQKYLSIDKNP